MWQRRRRLAPDSVHYCVLRPQSGGLSSIQVVCLSRNLPSLPYLLQNCKLKTQTPPTAHNRQNMSSSFSFDII